MKILITEHYEDMGYDSHEESVVDTKHTSLSDYILESCFENDKKEYDEMINTNKWFGGQWTKHSDEYFEWETDVGWIHYKVLERPTEIVKGDRVTVEINGNWYAEGKVKEVTLDEDEYELIVESDEHEFIVQVPKLEQVEMEEVEDFDEFMKDEEE